MPFKHNAARRHRIPWARYRVTNWAAYEAGLRPRGDIAVWVDEAALAEWQAPRRSTPGGQPRSDLAIKLVLTLRLVFHLALRQAEGFARSVLARFGHNFACSRLQQNRIGRDLGLVPLHISSFKRLAIPGVSRE